MIFCQGQAEPHRHRHMGKDWVQWDDRAISLRFHFIGAVALRTIFASTDLQGCCRGMPGDRAALQSLDGESKRQTS